MPACACSFPERDNGGVSMAVAARGWSGRPGTVTGREHPPPPMGDQNILRALNAYGANRAGTWLPPRHAHPEEKTKPPRGARNRPENASPGAGVGISLFKKK